MATVSEPTGIRQHYSDIHRILRLSPPTLESLTNKYFQAEIIDLDVRSAITDPSEKKSGATVLLDHLILKIEQNSEYLPTIIEIMSSAGSLNDIVQRMGHTSTASTEIIALKKELVEMRIRAETAEAKLLPSNNYTGYSIFPKWSYPVLSSLQYGVVPVYRTIQEFSQHKTANNDSIYTDPFYTSNGGYNMMLCVIPNGYGCYKGAHVSVGICLMRGPNDDNLQFPINGIFTLQMLNWKEDNHHCEKSIAFDDDIPIKHRQQVLTGDRADSWGKGDFMSHNELRTSNSRYLDNDRMCFRISYEPLPPQTGGIPVPSWCDVIYSNSATPPCTRTMYNYTSYKKTNSYWLRQPFYSSDKGYKLQLRVDANGVGSGKGTHLSVYVYLMKGEYDDTLSWPFNGTITVQLLNWSSDNHHVEETIPHYTASLEYRERVIEGTTAPGRGYDQFISLTVLQDCTNNTIELINDNRICFRIIKVDIINNRCTIQ